MMIVCKHGGNEGKSATATRAELRRVSDRQHRTSPLLTFSIPTQCTETVNSIVEMPGMMDKGSEYLGKGRTNGTKSPSNASNGHFSDESGSDDEHGGYRLGSNNAHLPPASAFLFQIFYMLKLFYYFFVSCPSRVSSRCGDAGRGWLPGDHPRVWARWGLAGLAERRPAVAALMSTNTGSVCVCCRAGAAERRGRSRGGAGGSPVLSQTQKTHKLTQTPSKHPNYTPKRWFKCVYCISTKKPNCIGFFDLRFHT